MKKRGLSTDFRMKYSRFCRRMCLSEAYGKNCKGLTFDAEISNYAMASAKP